MATITVAGREVPAQHIAIALPVLAALYLGYAWFIPDDAIGKRLDDISNKEAGLETKRNEAKELKQRTKEVDKVQAEMEALNKSIVLLKQQIPTDAQVPVLLFDLERMARASSNAMSSFQPGSLRTYTPEGQAPAANNAAAANAAAGATSDIQELPVSIKATGTYPEVIKFLEALGSYERKLNISNLSLTPGSEGKASAAASAAAGNSGKEAGGFKNTLNIDFTLLAYVLKAPDAPAAAPAGAPATPRRRPKAGGSGSGG